MFIFARIRPTHHIQAKKLSKYWMRLSGIVDIKFAIHFKLIHINIVLIQGI